MLGVQAPADARARHPLRELGQRLGRNAKARGHGGHFQQIDQLAHAAALRGQAQEPGHGGNQRAAGLGAHVGNVKGNMARVPALVLAKHRADGRGQRLDVGHHDDDVARVQGCLARVRRGLGQRLQELVVQHFEFAHRAVRAVKDDGAVLRANGALGVLVQGHQVANAVLHLLQ